MLGLFPSTLPVLAKRHFETFFIFNFNKFSIFNASILFVLVVFKIIFCTTILFYVTYIRVTCFGVFRPLVMVLGIFQARVSLLGILYT